MVQIDDLLLGQPVLGSGWDIEGALDIVLDPCPALVMTASCRGCRPCAATEADPGAVR